MGYSVKVSLKSFLFNPMFCVVCGSHTKVYPRGYLVLGRTFQLLANYQSTFFFPVCDQCATEYRTINIKRKRFRTSEEKAFLKLYDKQAVQCTLGYHPLLGIKWAEFVFYRKDYAEEYYALNVSSVIK